MPSASDASNPNPRPLKSKRVPVPAGKPSPSKFGPRNAGSTRKPYGPPKAGPRRDFGPKTGERFDRAPAPGTIGPGVRIVHEDGELIIIDKPPGLLTAGMAGETRVALLDLLKRHLMATSPPPRNRKNARELREAGRLAEARVGVLHRLDKEASGLVVFSKTDKAFNWLKEDFKSKRVHRIYLALVEGEMGKPGDAGTIQSYLHETPSGKVESIPADQFRGRTDKPDAPDAARLAVTHFRIIAVGNGKSLVQARLETGRKHQIRAHFGERGHPLVGDPRYGAKDQTQSRLGLHASELGFTHPGTGQKQRWSSAAPAHFYTTVGAAAPVETPSASSATAAPTAPAPFSLPARPQPAADTSWNQVAGWYDELLSDKGNDHYQQVIIPGVVRLVGPSAGMRILDVACGQGIISRALAELGAEVTGVDAAPELIEAAKSRAVDRTRFLVGDARELGALQLEPGFDQAICTMALTNIEPLEPVLRGIASLLRTGGACTFVIVHPAFRAPGQTDWGWDDAKRKQYRRVDGYLSPGQHRIDMNPGRSAKGEAPVITWTFHRPLQTYARLLGECGLLIQTIEEWPAQRVSTSGPRAEEENRARREIPLFLAARAIKIPAV